MFAFCIYDRRDGSLFLARDRFGEKPLFYAQTEHDFGFSSEVKSLLCHSGIARRLDRQALAYYLRAGIVPAPLTMLQDVRVLPPGHWLKWCNSELDVQPYFVIDYQPDPAFQEMPDAVKALQAQLHQAVQRQSISDVPLGALLSGGIDSCAVASTLQATATHPVKTFTVRFEDARYDEGDIASQVARHLGTEHHEFVVGNATFKEDDLWRIIDHVGLPFFDSSAIPTYILSNLVVGHVKVALSGDGGDELFAGYDSFQWGLKLSRRRWPSSLLRRCSDGRMGESTVMDGGRFRNSSAATRVGVCCGTCPPVAHRVTQSVCARRIRSVAVGATALARGKRKPSAADSSAEPSKGLEPSTAADVFSTKACHA